SLQTRLADDGRAELLAWNGRKTTKLPRRNLHVLRADRVRNIHRSQGEVVQLGRIEPDAHRILRTEDLEVADTRGTRDGVLDVGHDVVRQVASGHAAVGGNHTEHHEEVTHGLGHPDALLLHFLRQQRRGQLQLVLYLHLGDIRVGALVEGDGDRHAAVGVALRGHVTEAVDAVHLLFDDLHHGVLHRLRGCTRVADLDTNGRRGDAGVLVDGQAKNGE